MKKTNLKTQLFLVVAMLYGLQMFAQKAQENYKNFKVAVYARAYEVREMDNLAKLDSIWTVITQQVKVDKIYLETHRDKIIVDEKTIEKAKKYFISKGVKVAGGITFTIDESNHFETFCYTNPEQRKLAQQIAELTAKYFDEFILDDFFFTSCKCDLCIDAKGEQSWTNFRLKLMRDAGTDLIIKPAKAINPNVKVIIKYPNWYEHFQGLGFNLEESPSIFDGIYTGTETRDPVRTGQHLQQYESYLVLRYFNNIKPGGNGGGWVDPGAAFYLDRYVEQLWNTLFAKSPEITLFDYRQLQRPIDTKTRAAWQGQKTSFDFDEMLQPIQLPGGKTVKPTTIARACGLGFEKVDKILGKLGNPVSIKTYRPYHSTGEDFLQNYLGMIGLPMDILPYYPKDEKMILLTEEAKFDKDIVSKIENSLKSGSNVIITSGLLKSLQGKGIENIVELKYTDRKVSLKNFVVGWAGICEAKNEILIPQIEYLTNDSWEDISSVKGATGFPILHQVLYSKGSLFVLTIPDNFSDLYQYPDLVLNRIREVASQNINVRMEGSAQVALFVYDNGTFIAKSYLHEPTTIKIIANQPVTSLTELQTNEIITGTPSTSGRVWGRSQVKTNIFEITLKPHSFKAFQMK